MCNLYSATMPVEAMRRLFGVGPERDRAGNQPPLPAIYPKYAAPVVRLGEDGGRELLPMQWGFLTPQRSKKTGKPIKPAAWTNARDDKLRSAGLWKASFAARRCLIPATSFCEATGRAPATYHWFAMVGDEDRPPFAFAGLWRRDPLAEIPTYTLVTTAPNALVRDIHPTRMPVILPPERWEAWLTAGPDDAFALIEPYPADGMRIVKSGEGAKEDAA